MKVAYENFEFVARVRFEDRMVAKAAGFHFDKDRGVFTTRSVAVAARLREFADEAAKNKIDAQLIRITPWSSSLRFPATEKLEPYQERAVRYCLARNRAYAALAPGLGKTIVAAVVMNTRVIPTVYICPPFLMLNVRAELVKWGVDLARVLIVPDSMLIKPVILHQINDWLAKYDRAMLVVDEAHRFKTAESKRTVALFKTIFPLFNYSLFMSGTPMPNRPMELFSVLSAAAPETIGFRNRFEYGRHYCAGYRDHMGHWDFSGASNLKELAPAVHAKFMIRVKKTELTLPPLIEEMVIVGEKPGAKLAALDAKVLAAISPDDIMRGKLAGEGDHISTYRRELGLEKAKAGLPFIRSILEETDEKVFLAAIHKDAIAYLATELAEYNPLLITGSVEKFKRHTVAKTFQTDKSCRLIIANIQAGGVGFNLTAGDRIILVEYSWVPAENRQVIDRLHRYGRKSSVLAQYLVFNNSIDRAVLEACFNKERVTCQV